MSFQITVVYTIKSECDISRDKYLLIPTSHEKWLFFKNYFGFGGSLWSRASPNGCKNYFFEWRNGRESIYGPT